MPKHKPNRKNSTSESDSGSDERAPPKKSKTSSSSKSNDSDGGDVSWDLGRNKLIRLSEFKGKWYVNIREFYNSNGELKPTKKGVMLTMEQYQKFKSFIEDIDDAIKRNV